MSQQTFSNNSSAWRPSGRVCEVQTRPGNEVFLNEKPSCHQLYKASYQSLFGREIDEEELLHSLQSKCYELNRSQMPDSLLQEMGPYRLALMINSENIDDKISNLKEFIHHKNVLSDSIMAALYRNENFTKEAFFEFFVLILFFPDQFGIQDIQALFNVTELIDFEDRLIPKQAWEDFADLLNKRYFNLAE